MSVDLTVGIRYRQSSPEFPVGRYFKFRIEGSIEGRFGYHNRTDDIDLSLGSTSTISPGEISTESEATISADLYTACEDSIKISVEQKLGSLLDFITGDSEKTAEQVLAEITTININWQGVQDGGFGHTSVAASIAPFALFVQESTFVELSVTERFTRKLFRIRNHRIIVTGIFTCAIPIGVTPAGVIRIGQVFYRSFARTVNLTIRVGSWMSRAFAASGTVGVGVVVVSGAIVGSAVSTGFCMWLIEQAHIAGVTRGLTNQMASGFVRYLFDREHIFANLVEHRGDQYQARVRGGNMAYRDCRFASEPHVKEIWRARLFPNQPRVVSDSFVRANIGVAIDRMTLILEASGEVYHAG